jgi:ATP-dependent DNA helicase RecG
MVKSNDGFEIAEADMKLRGFGDLEGTQQSGEGLSLHIANLATDGQIVQYTRTLAENILEKDPNLESEMNRLLRERLRTLFGRKVAWGKIG